MTGNQEITPEEAHARRDELHAVDVRAEHEFDGPLGYVPGSCLVPMPELTDRIAELPAGRPLLIVCRSGNRSGKACERLTALGIGPVINLAGGMIEWNRKQLPVERRSPRTLGALLENLAVWMTQVGSLDLGGVHKVMRRRLETIGSDLDRPSKDAVAKLIDFVEESLAQSGLPDLDLSIDSFRASLAELH
jgi:rhodanese-related sulfurtransferase